MVMKADFDAAAVRVFDAFGDLITDVTLSQPGAWNPITQTQTPTVAAIRVARRAFKREETDGVNVMTGDLEVAIIQSELTATPKIDDTITMEGANYLTRGVTNVHGVLWRLHLRRV